jgi:hypothetical protein
LPILAQINFHLVLFTYNFDSQRKAADVITQWSTVHPES